ncbi:MAG: hypothetical protein N2318_03280 [Meiothermus sp.]|nr:hypothetical protein [Meiothermus sp.]
MDDRRYNRARLLLLLVLVGYFVYLHFSSQQPEQPLPTPPAQTQGQPAAPAAPAAQPARPAQPALLECPGRIEQVAVSNYEVRLRITGAASTILVYTDQGNVTASTTEAGSAGEYRVRTPGPATAVQLDDCPPLNVR